MAETIRVGVSMDKELVEALDALTIAHNHPNRSETLRALVRHQLIKSETDDPQSEVTAVVSLIYHYQTTLQRVELSQYPSLELKVNLKMHIHEDIVIKILVVSGKYGEVQQWASLLTGQKQVVGTTTITAAQTIYANLR